jgi:GTP-binding protein LepA
MPDVNRIDEIQEPWIQATIYCPDEYLGSILKLCQDRRGIQKQLTYVGGRAQIVYELPLNEVVFDFYDRLKSISRGYASFDYHQIGHREGDRAICSKSPCKRPSAAKSSPAKPSPQCART